MAGRRQRDGGRTMLAAQLSGPVRGRFFEDQIGQVTPVLQKVKMDEIRVMFVESQDDYVQKLKEHLPENGDAVYVEMLSSKASNLNGDYYSAPQLTRGGPDP